MIDDDSQKPKRSERLPAAATPGHEANEANEANEDRAGPLIGWSLGTGLAKRPLEQLVEFPCTYTFKTVGVAQDGFVRGLLERVATVLGRSITLDEHAIRESARGRYKSVTMNLFVTSCDQVYDIYAALKADERVRYVF